MGRYTPARPKDAPEQRQFLLRPVRPDQPTSQQEHADVTLPSLDPSRWRALDIGPRRLRAPRLPATGHVPVGYGLMIIGSRT